MTVCMTVTVRLPTNDTCQTDSCVQDEEAKLELEGGDEFIEVKVTAPHKVGGGQEDTQTSLC